MNSITSAILNFLLSILNKVIPVLNLPDGFISSFDNSLAFVITLIKGACFFIPLDIFGLCFTTMFIADNFALFARLGQFIIKLIRG